MLPLTPSAANLRPSPFVAPSPAPSPSFSSLPDNASPAAVAIADILEPAPWDDEALLEIPEDGPLVPESAAAVHLIDRASLWDIVKDGARELATCLRDAYASFCRDGFVEAGRSLTSHLAQLAVVTSAFLIFNLGRRIHALWQRVRGGP